MPFGINSASEILQKKAFQAFRDIEGVHCLADDTLIAARNADDVTAIHYKLRVQYRPRSQLYIADTLSTASVREKVYHTEQEKSEDIVQVHCATATMPATTEKLRQIKEATKEDINVL
ncbi:hypothetical protein RRG08_018470 [Elysia crispata]|uniref:Uncharacterized protein n=1 Tax=Elysia crispata TaxID=231223 RepID=A0AAE1D523_9GAST|nr:hypothetical protein RRG08_018470 [Elysia crispata]